MGIETVALMAVAGATVAGTAMQMAGNVQEGRETQAAYQAKSQADMFNAAIANQRAASERAAAAAQALDVEREGSRKLGQMLAARGTSGVTPSGSPLMVDATTVREIALGIERTKYVGEKRARGLETEAELLEMSALEAQRAGGIARTTGYMKAGTSLLSGIASTGKLFMGK